MTTPVPEWLRGLWRRRSIEYPDGRRDATTIVYWLQTESAFADIRIPIDRPDLRTRTGFDALGEADFPALAGQAGFAGWTELDGDLCRWQRVIDYQPPTGVPDEGRLRQQDGVLIEEGVHEPYVEVWEPIGRAHGSPALAGGAKSYRTARDILVVWADAFIFARDRSAPLPPAASLATLIGEAGGRREEIVQLLNCEISFGVRPTTAGPWEIQLSTFPWREGEAFDPASSSP